MESATFSALAGFHVSLLLLLFAFAFKKSDRNRVFGIRTAYTLESDENWRYVHHKAARPVMIASGLGMVFFAVSLFAPALQIPWLLWSVLGAEIAVLISMTFVRRPKMTP